MFVVCHGSQTWSGCPKTSPVDNAMVMSYMLFRLVSCSVEAKADA
jgi:hypothetical protein